MSTSMIRLPILRASFVLNAKRPKQLSRYNSTDTKCPGKLLYEGKLSRRVLALKSVSYLTSGIITTAYYYAIASKGLGTTIAVSGLVLAPFGASPFVIAWMFKRYVTKLYYNEAEETFTLKHCGLFLNQKTLVYNANDVVKSDPASILNTFEVKGKSFFLHDEDLIDSESVRIYKKMLSIS